MRNFLDIKDIASDELKKIISFGIKIKSDTSNYASSLLNKKMILFLEKNSTRTRVSFEFGIKELGGHCCVLNAENTQVSRGESIEDTARVFDRMADVIVVRTFEHKRLMSIVDNCKHACVINALTNQSHPCQVMADIMTFVEVNGSLEKLKKIAWFGDVNNMLISWLEASEKFNFEVNICCPESLYGKVKQNSAGKNWKYKLFTNKIDASQGCDIITTDTWVSMGEDKKKADMFLNGDFIVDNNVMKNADKKAIFLHCLPAYRGYEVAEDVIDDKARADIIFQEAENRLHIQKAILMYCFEKI